MTEEKFKLGDRVIVKDPGYRPFRAEVRDTVPPGVEKIRVRNDQGIEFFVPIAIVELDKSELKKLARKNRSR